MTHKDPFVQTEYTVRMGHAQAWATSVTDSNMTRLEAYMEYHGILQAKLGYAFAVTTFFERELRKITSGRCHVQIKSLAQ